MIQHNTRNRLLALLLTLCMVCGMLPAIELPAAAVEELTDGTGTKDSPLPIHTAEELVQVGQMINDGSIWSILGLPENTRIYYRLKADISLTNVGGTGGWVPIGTEEHPFTGHFDGGGYVISGLTMNIKDTHTDPNTCMCYGLFGVVGSGGAIARITLQDVSITCENQNLLNGPSAGGIAGRLLEGGVIEHCFVSGEFYNRTPYGGNGGIVGFLDGGEVRNCLVTASMASGFPSGGISGSGQSNRRPWGTVAGCMVLSKQISGYAIDAENRNVSVSDCFVWEGVNATRGFGGAAAKTTEELQTAAGWPKALSSYPWAYEAGFEPSLTGTAQPLPYYVLNRFSGTGTPKDPYLIGSLSDLAEFRRQCAQNSFAGVSFRLTRDLDMDQYALYDQSYDKEKGWNPIRTFRGNFDGGHHVIRNLYINRPEEDYVGFFGYLYGNIESSPLSDVRDGTRGLVQNLGLEEAEVTGKAATGALVGEMTYGQVFHCYSTGKVSGGGRYQTTNYSNERYTRESWYTFLGAGGLVGVGLGSAIVGCYSTADVTGIMSVGGVAGFFWGTLTDCYATGDILSKYANGVGGVLGMDHSDGSLIARCYSTGKVTAGGSLTWTRSNIWTGTGGVVGFGVGICRDLIALNPSVTNFNSTDYFPLNELEQSVARRVIGKVIGSLWPYTKGNWEYRWSNMNYNGMVVNGVSDMWADSDNNAEYFKLSSTWAAFSESGEWDIQNGQLPTLKKTGEKQSGETPDWMVDKPNPDYAVQPALNGDTYAIESEANLAWCALNPGELDNKTLDIKRDLDLSGYSLGTGWRPIGMETKETIYNLKVNGNNHTISNLYVNQRHNRVYELGTGTVPSENANYGLFGCLSNATIRDLHIRNAEISGGDVKRAGLLVANATDGLTVWNCSAQGIFTMEYAARLGGIAGSVQASCSMDQVSAKYSYEQKEIGNNYAGGILGVWERGGDSRFSVSNAFSEVNISEVDGAFGGIVGSMDGPYPYNEVNTILSNCYSRCNVSFSDPSVSEGGSSIRGTGGLIGAFQYITTTGKAFRISNCYVLGSYEGAFTGGVFGQIFNKTGMPDTDKETQIQLQNVLIAPEKLDGVGSVGLVCGANTAKAKDGHNLAHFRSITTGDKDKRFTQDYTYYSEMKLILGGKDLVSAQEITKLGDFAYFPYFTSIKAINLFDAVGFADNTWNTWPWVKKGALLLPTLSNLDESRGQLHQSGSLPLYLLSYFNQASSVFGTIVEISTREDLNALSKFVAEGGNTKGITFTLENTIEMGNSYFTPIGTSKYPFEGTFNGKGYAVKGLRVANSGGPAGFIGVLGKDGTIQDLAVVDPDIYGGQDVGGLVGLSSGTVRRCYTAAQGVSPWSGDGTTQVSGASNVGGLIGRITGEDVSSLVENCYTAVNVVARTNNAGGIVGKVDAVTSDAAEKRVNYCYIVGKVTSLGDKAGGIYGSSGAGDQLMLRRMVILSSGIYSKNGATDCAIGGDATAKALSQAVIWDGTGCTTKMSYERVSMKELGDAKNSWPFYFPASSTSDAWLFQDDTSAMLAGFREPQFNYIDPLLYDDPIPAFQPLEQVEGYYLVNSAEDWETMGRMVNERYGSYNKAKFRLTSDISFKNALAYLGGYIPVGNGLPFTGELDGGGHTVTFDPARFAEGNVGLFGTLGDGAWIHDLTVNAAIESTADYTGAVAACANPGSRITGVTVTGTVTYRLLVQGKSRLVGGVVGFADGCIIEDCVNRAAVTGGSSTGGIVGLGSAGKIENCRNEGNVTGESNAGGILGLLRRVTVHRCGNLGSVTGGDAGGIAGYAEGRDDLVTDGSALFNTGTVTGSSRAGGIVGYAVLLSLQDVYSTGSISGAREAGGLVGLFISGSLTRGYATGMLSGGQETGGIAGRTVKDNNVGGGSFVKQVAALNQSIGGGSRIIGINDLQNNPNAIEACYGLDTLKSKNETLAGQDVTRIGLRKAEFWTGTLGFSPDVWEIPSQDTELSDFTLPTLKECGKQTAGMPLHLEAYAREGVAKLKLKTDKTQLWSPKGQAESVIFTANITGTTQTTVDWNCSDTNLSTTGGTDDAGNPICRLVIPEGYAGGEITVMATLTANRAISDPATVKVNARTNAQSPRINVQPKDTPTVVGKPARLTVEAESPDGGTLTYQWYRSDVAGEDGTAIDKATELSYEAPAEQTEIAYYYCIVTNTIPDGEGVGKTTATMRSDTAQVTVTKDAQQALTIVGGNRTATYGDEAFQLRINGGSGSGKVTWKSDRPELVAVDQDGKVTILGATPEQKPATITAIKEGDSRYDPSSAHITVTVNKATLTVRPDDNTRAYGQPNPAFTCTITGFVNNEDASVLKKQPVASCEADEKTPAGTPVITASGGEADNYTFDYQVGTLTITQAGQEPLAFRDGNQYNKTYGDKAFQLILTGGSGNGAVKWESSDESVAAVDQDGKVTVLKTGEARITATKAAAGNYAEAQATAVVKVGKATLTVTAANAEKSYGEKNPELRYEVIGYVGAENDSVLKEKPRIFVDTEIPELELPVGSYVIKVEGGLADNYEILPQNAILVVNKAGQTTFAIEGGDPLKSYGDGPFTLTAKNGAGGAVTWQSSDESVATVDETTGKVTIVGAGRTLITAVSAETVNYTEAIAGVTLTVKKADLTIQADPKTKVYGEENPAFTYRFAGFVNGDTAEDLESLPVLTADAEKTTGVGRYAIRLIGGEDSNYAYVLTGGELEITPRPVTVKADDKEMTEGGAIPELTWTVTEGSLLEGDTLEGSLKADGSGMGSHPIIEDFPLANPNYAVTFLPGTLTVKEKPKNPSAPQTGDDFPVWPLWLPALSMGGVLFACGRRRKKSK